MISNIRFRRRHSGRSWNRVALSKTCRVPAGTSSFYLLKTVNRYLLFLSSFRLPSPQRAGERGTDTLLGYRK
jgi:hypothetical protein